MEYKFSELFTWTSGKPITASTGEIPIYGSNGIVGYTGTAKYQNKIILGRVGAYCGSTTYCKGAFNATDNTLITACDESKIIYPYAYYLLKQYHLNDYAGGAAQPLITQSILKHLKCDVPNIVTQEKTVEILSKYDELIEVNNQRIKKLEQTVEELHKEWFVRFRFPNWQNTEFEKSSLGRIPSSFKVLKMSDVISYYIGGGWGADIEDSSYPQKAYVIRGTDFPKVEKGDISSIPCRYHKESNYKARSLKENDIVIEISGGTAEQPVGRAILVSKQVLNRLDNQVICASFCKQLRLNTEIISPIYYLYWMKFLYDTRMIERYQLQSTGIINFKFEYFLKKGDVLLPPVELMNGFTQKVSALREQIDILATQNENLIKQRDYLLPRLMSGKLEVYD